MTGDAGEGWQALPVELTDAELLGWCREIPRPVALTGSTGFVGSHVVTALVAGGLRPVVLVRDRRRLVREVADKVDVVVGELGDRQALRALVERAGTVLHLAGVVRAGNAGAFDAGNRQGTANVVEACGEVAPAVRLVYVSSLAAAGPSPDPGGRGPEDPPDPVSAYGRSKLAGEHAVRSFHGPWTILRPPAIYGPRDVDVLQFFRLAARGLVPLPGGERWVTMAYVTDVVRAVLAAGCGKADGGVVHVGEPVPYTMDRLIELLAEAGGVRARAVHVPPVVVRCLGGVGSGLQRLGWRSVAMTADKAAELLARHWTARTGDSLRRLGLDGYVPFSVGAAASWAWYRERGILPRGKIPGR